MKGNFHVRFLEEGERATVLLYSAIELSVKIRMIRVIRVLRR